MNVVRLAKWQNKWKYQACPHLLCGSETSDLERQRRKTEPTVLNTHKVTSMSYERTVLEALSSTNRVLLLYMLHFFSVLITTCSLLSPEHSAQWQWTSYLSSSNYDFLLLFIDSLFSTPVTLYRGKHHGVSKAWRKWSMFGSRRSSGRVCGSSRKPGFDL